MSESERKEFMSWYDAQKDKVFDNRRVLEQYCQDDVTILRQAYQIFRIDFMEVGNVDVFLESCTIASTCNKVLRKRFLKPETIGLIPSGGYSCNRNYSKKAVMWIWNRRTTAQYNMLETVENSDFPELPRYGVHGYCSETRTVIQFWGCFYHGHSCQPFRDLTTMSDDTLAERYERTMLRIEQITKAGYAVKLIWECEWDAAKIIEKKPEL